MNVQLQRLLAGDELLARLQDNVQSAISQITVVDILGGRLIHEVVLAQNEDNEINHGLDKPLKGWIVVRQNAEAALWDSQDDSPTPSKTLTLNTSNDCTVTLWVF